MDEPILVSTTSDTVAVMIRLNAAETLEPGPERTGPHHLLGLGGIEADHALPAGGR